MATKVELRQLQKITTEALLDILLSDGVISAKKMKAGITDAQLAFLNGVTGAIQTQLNEKLSQSLLGKDGSVDWNSDLQIATAKAIAVKIASEIAAAGIAGTMAFKGNWSAVPAASTLGYTYVYDSGTPPTGLTLEVGDMLIAAVDNANINIAAHWTVVQANISGAVTGVETAVTDGQLVVFNGSGGKSVKKSTVNGLLKAVNGVISAATESDLPAHNHNIVFELEGSTLNATTAEAVKIKGVGATTVKSDGNQININTPLPTPVNITNGGAVSNQYVTGASVADNAVTLVRTTLPAIPVDVQAYYRANVVPAGAKDDGNKKYTLPEAIVAGSLQLFCNGVLLTPTTDYIISGVTITLTTDMFAPSAGTVLLATYIKA